MADRTIHVAAKEAGITVLNGCGLDPGIDHLLAVETISRVHRARGSIKSFRSYCGALPALDCANNPFGYKFSWSPRGVLQALQNPAKYIINGKVETVAGSELMDSALPFPQAGPIGLVSYPNRDAMTYRDRYGIFEAETVIRSTLRYKHFPIIVKALTEAGFFLDVGVSYLDPSKEPIRYRDMTREITDAASTDEVSVM